MMKENEIEKWIWTEEDFDRMGWHDSTVYAFAWASDNNELLLDIDYILKWAVQDRNEAFYKFLLVPATLSFTKTHDLSIDLEVFQEITIQDIRREVLENGRKEWLWIIESNQGEIRFKATGFNQYLRKAPAWSEIPKLSEAARGGISVSKVPHEY